MKNTIFAVLCFTTLVSCRLSNQNKAEANVSEYLSKSLDDPGSYQPIGFDSLEISVKYDEMAPEMLKNAKYTILHTYRSKNVFSALMINEEVFYLDYNLNVLGHLSKEESAIRKTLYSNSGY